MRHYFVFELRKLLSRWQFVLIFLLALVLTGAYIAYFFENIVQLYAFFRRLQPKTSFDKFFYSSLSGRINSILVLSCALVSTLVWESETGGTLQRVLRLSPSKVYLFLFAKISICLTLLVIEMCVLWLAIGWFVSPFIPMLVGNNQFNEFTLARFLAIQWVWMIPILLLNICWYIWLGERAVVVFIFALFGVYLLGFISFTPFHTFLLNKYGEVNTYISDIIWMISWTVSLVFFLRKRLINYV